MNRRHAVLFLFDARHGRTRAGTTAAATGPRVVVHKNESCGCCKLWVTHLEKAGFTAEVINEDNLGPIKERVGVPYGKGSCHTAEVGGYFVEGHVPAADIQRLLKERPQAKGLTVPGYARRLAGNGECPPDRWIPTTCSSSRKTARRPFAHHGPK